MMTLWFQVYLKCPESWAHITQDHEFIHAIQHTLRLIE